MFLTFINIVILNIPHIIYLCFNAMFHIVDGYGLDKDYRDVYSKYRCNDDFESMDTGDLPPSDTALFCRRYFKELELL